MTSDSFSLIVFILFDLVPAALSVYDKITNLVFQINYYLHYLMKYWYKINGYLII